MYSWQHAAAAVQTRTLAKKEAFSSSKSPVTAFCRALRDGMEPGGPTEPDPMLLTDTPLFPKEGFVAGMLARAAAVLGEGAVKSPESPRWEE